LPSPAGAAGVDAGISADEPCWTVAAWTGGKENFWVPFAVKRPNLVSNTGPPNSPLYGWSYIWK
jgi:hypothetical protein